MSSSSATQASFEHSPSKPTPHAVAAAWIIAAISVLVFAAGVLGVWHLVEGSEPRLETIIPVQH